MPQLRRALISLSLMIIFMLILQVVRMGLVSESENIYNIPNRLPLATSTFVEPDAKNSRYLIVYNQDEELSVNTKSSLSYMLQYQKAEVNVKEAKEFNNEYEGYKAVIIASGDWGIVSLDKLSSYVEKGGNVLLAIMPNVNSAYYSLGPALGIRETGTIKENKGVITKSDFLIAGRDKKYIVAPWLVQSLYVQLSDKCIVHMTSDDGAPLLWQVKHGSGNFIVSNTPMISYKSGRGVATGALSLLDDFYIYPITNAWVEFITGFPASADSINSMVIKKYYSTDVNSFVRKKWWPDMAKLAYKYNMVYTSIYVQNYNDVVEPPFFAEGLTRNDLISLGTEVMRSGGEMGFHGYNYRPLGLKDTIGKGGWFIPWPGITEMEQATKAICDFTRASFPNYTLRCYVPPAGQLTEEGRTAMLKYATGVKIISGVYEKYYQDQLVQEFSPGKDGIAEFPLAAIGSDPSKGSEWQLVNTAESLGIISHDISLIDIMYPTQSDKTWDKIMPILDGLFKRSYDTYGFLDRETVTNASEKVLRHTILKVNRKKESNSMTVFCENLTPGSSFILRTDRAISSSTGCMFKRIATNAYIITAQTPKFSLAWNGG